MNSTSQGWTKATARRMRSRLMDIQTSTLTHPHALTLTMSEAHARPQHLAGVVVHAGAQIEHHALLVAALHLPPDAGAVVDVFLRRQGEGRIGAGAG